MVDFRRWITALAVLALFAGLASAQVGGSGSGNGPLACSATVAVPPQLRSESITDLIGDVVITCTGGQAPAVGQPIPTANITVSLATNVTSRILTSSGGLSEALLLIDEPGAAGLSAPGGPGTGPLAAQTVCAVAGGASVNGCGVQSVGTSNGIPVAIGPSGGAAHNVFLGTVSGNQVIFNGIPILAPVSSGVTRVFRLTNIRANISGLGGGGLAGTSPLQASIAISGSTSVPVNNPVVIAGFIQQGLTTGIRNATSTGTGSIPLGLNQCGPGNDGGNPRGTATISFAENFATAFKTRLAAGVTSQNVPGTIYNAESGFTLPNTFSPAGFSFQPGLSDFGTRLKAVFNNIPTGVRVFVSTTNLAVSSSTTGTNAPTTAVPALSATAPFAQLVPSEAAQYGSVSVSTGSVNSGNTAIFELPVVAGSATAVWEVYNANPASADTLYFGVWTQFSPNAANNTPPAGTATVNLSFAPTSTVTSASSSAPIPRFADTSTARSIFSINICQTLLLFPFVTNMNGFDTGLAIANTSTDPVGTGAQAGSCDMFWYDGTGKTPKVNSGNIATGTVYTALVSGVAAGFQGYMIAQCNFQFAHGFAFISDLGARNLAMGYLALVVSNGSVSRGPAGEALGN